VSSSLEVYTIEGYVLLKAKRALARAGRGAKREFNTLKTEVRHEVKTMKKEIKRELTSTKHAARVEVAVLMSNVKKDFKRMTKSCRSRPQPSYDTAANEPEFSVVNDDPADFVNEEADDDSSENYPADVPGQPKPFERAAAARSRRTKIKHCLSKAKTMAKDSVPRPITKAARTAKLFAASVLSGALPPI